MKFRCSPLLLLDILVGVYFWNVHFPTWKWQILILTIFFEIFRFKIKNWYWYNIAKSAKIVQWIIMNFFSRITMNDKYCNKMCKRENQSFYDGFRCFTSSYISLVSSESFHSFIMNFPFSRMVLTFMSSIWNDLIDLELFYRVCEIFYYPSPFEL